MRIFKLARRSVGLQSMAYTVKNSWKVQSQADMGNVNMNEMPLAIKPLFIL